MTIEQIENNVQMEESERRKVLNRLSIRELYIVDKFIKAKEKEKQKAALRQILQIANA